MCSLDIKPENIIWTPKEELFFIDTESAVAPNTEPMKIATPWYLAPEFYQYWEYIDTKFHDEIKRDIDINRINAQDRIPYLPFEKLLAEIDTQTSIMQPDDRLDDMDGEMSKRQQFVQQQRTFDWTTFNCHLPDIIRATRKILSDEQGTSDERKKLQTAVASLQPLPGEELDDSDRELLRHFRFVRLVGLVDDALQCASTLVCADGLG